MQIEVFGIKKAYRKKTVLREVAFSAQTGSCIGIVGSNGSGKSTLLSILAGVRRADGGSFFYDGVDLLRRPGLIPKVLGYVPQGDPLMEELNAWDNLRMWYDRETLKKSLSGGALKMLGIGDFLKTPVHRMSGGMKKRLSIGCAVVSDPGILLLDEPSAALDPVCKERIRFYLESYKRAGGIVLMVTHDAQDLELCNECYILKDGVLRAYQYDGDFHRLAGIL
ncbi:MAG: ABC transporter ATP-binding protein [Lachnospiraceae bacterium]|nr:ABC transporter ATP-binding protein [Lachnospiraceae bacterium]